MDEFIFRSSQKFDNFQVQLGLTASQTKDIFLKYSENSKSLVVQVWNSSNFVQFRHNLHQLCLYLLNATREYQDWILYHLDLRKFYRNLIKVFWKKWTKRDIYFVSLGFLCGVVVGVYWSSTINPKETVRYYMQAIQCHHYLGIESAQVVEDACAPNKPDDDEVLITVKAASVQVIDGKISSGYGRLIRHFLRRLYKQSSNGLPVTLGRDCTGIVTDVGASVKRLEVGDEVWVTAPFWAQGTQSQTVLASEHRVGRKPRNIGFEGACSLPYAGCVALSALKQADLTPENAKNKRIFIQEGCSPVGCVLVQVLKHWQAQITISCYKKAEPVARALGANDIIILDREDVVNCLLKELKLRDTYDAVINTKDCGVTEKQLTLFTNSSNGLVVDTVPRELVSDECGFLASFAFGVYVRLKFYLEKLLGLPFDNFDEAHLCYAVLDELGEMVKNGHLQTVVDKVFHPQDIEVALNHIQSNESIGSTIITYR